MTALPCQGFIENPFSSLFFLATVCVFFSLFLWWSQMITHQIPAAITMHTLDTSKHTVPQPPQPLGTQTRWTCTTRAPKLNEWLSKSNRCSWDISSEHQWYPMVLKSCDCYSLIHCSVKKHFRVTKWPGGNGSVLMCFFSSLPFLTREFRQTWAQETLRFLKETYLNCWKRTMTSKYLKQMICLVETGNLSQVCAILAGLVVANNFDVARRPLMERSFGLPDMIGQEFRYQSISQWSVNLHQFALALADGSQWFKGILMAYIWHTAISHFAS